MSHEHYLDLAITLATESVNTGGGPFGAVIVRDETIVGRGGNRVTVWNDPTAHAEIVAIRDAAKRLADFTLKGCVLYCSCEPCPMCLAAAYWARIDAVYYAGTQCDAAAAGFDDRAIFEQLSLPHERKRIDIKNNNHPDSRRPFEQWLAKPDRVDY